MSFGVLFSIIMKKHRKPRLKQFRQALEKEGKYEITLYQYPAKIIFCILVIILMAVGLEQFSSELEAELFVLDSVANKPIDQVLSYEFAGEENINRSQHQQIMRNKMALPKLRLALGFVHIFELAALVTLLVNLNVKVVRSSKIDKVIHSIVYSKFGLMAKSEVCWVAEDDTIEIWEMGESRFTNTNYYYSIRVVSNVRNWEIIRKSNIYASRTAAISLGHLHSLPYSTKIINKTQLNHQ